MRVSGWETSNMFWLAAAVQLSEPVAVHFERWFSYKDMPSDVMSAGVTRSVVARTTVRPDGKIQSCAAEVSSGIQSLDMLTCSIIREQGKFKPANWSDGSAAYGVNRRQIFWAPLNVPTNRDWLVDFDLKVTELPKGLQSPLFAHIVVAVDDHGHVSSCAPEPTHGGDHRTDDPALIEMACDQFAKHWSGIPAKDADGKPVASVQNGLVRIHTPE